MTDPARVVQIFEAALLREGARRTAFVQAECVGDSDLQRRVEALLADAAHPVIIDGPVDCAVAELLRCGDDAPVMVGSALGPYRVDARLGAGGMGEVYLATDTGPLARQVALKILPQDFALDPDRVARFRREARLLASLNHPHLAHVYGFHEVTLTGGVTVHALAMEYVPGHTLAERLAGGPMPVDEALAVARQIAEGLEAAHQQQVIHRDLKPANIKITPDGQVKILDFGLAKAGGLTPTDGTGTTHSPTITSPALITGAGVLLGTAAYMSPEQAKGRDADKRSDVWAFGCVLYEMLTGRRAFDGDDVVDVLGAVARLEPNWDALPADVPMRVRALLRDCLVKDRSQRVGDIAVALYELKRGVDYSPDAVRPVPPPSPPLWRRALAPAVVAAMVALATGLGVRFGVQPTRVAPATVSRFTIALPVGQRLGTARNSIAISRDGSRIAFVTAENQLMVRSVSEFDTHVLLTEGDTARPNSRIASPTFSPDGESVAFVAAGSLKRVAVSGGAPVVLCDVTFPSDLAWTADGILFSEPGVGIYRVPSSGGRPELLIAQKPPEGVRAPQWLPDGRSVLLTVTKFDGGDAVTAEEHIVVQSMATGERKTIVESGSDARYLPTGHLVYARDGTLFASRFDPVRRAVDATAAPIVAGVRRSQVPTTSVPWWSVSDTGTLIYAPGPATRSQNGLFLFDRQGMPEALNVPPGAYQVPRVSPDGTRAAFQVTDRNEEVISVYDLSGSSQVRRVTLTGNSRYPVWYGNDRIVFQDARGGLSSQTLDGGRLEALTTSEPGTSHIAESWSGQANALLYRVIKNQRSSLWVLNLRDHSSTPFSSVSSSTLPTNASFSPDGRWVAYQLGLNESLTGEGRTYVEPFPPTGARYQVADGGRPAWSHDGRELFYIPGAERLMVMSVATTPAFAVTVARQMTRGFGASSPASPRGYDIAADGRILGVAPVAGNPAALPSQINVVLNWFTELNQVVPIE